MRLIYINGRLIPAQIVNRTVDFVGRDEIELVFDIDRMNSIGLLPSGIEFVDVVDFEKQRRYIYRRQPRLQFGAGDMDYQYTSSELRVTCINETDL